jgi:hypothetical protein
VRDKAIIARREIGSNMRDHESFGLGARPAVTNLRPRGCRGFVTKKYDAENYRGEIARFAAKYSVGGLRGNLRDSALIADPTS